VSEELELFAATGFVEPRVREEFPRLGLRWMSVEASPGRAPRPVKLRLRSLSNRYHGATVVTMRAQPIPHAYRSFFRHIGLDPDANRIPSEDAAVARLLQGGFRSKDLVADGLLIALLETGVPVWALDADRVEAGGLGIRTTMAGDRFGSSDHHLPEGRLVVADPQRIHALLFGAVAPGSEVTAKTRRIALFAVGVDGVPDIHVEEALWTCGEVLAAT
jgi:DNA/RNA-binding domain of Phe-tRNA-synthetase-like protein